MKLAAKHWCYVKPSRRPFVPLNGRKNGTESQGKADFPGLLMAACNVNGINLIRLISSSESGI